MVSAMTDHPHWFLITEFIKWTGYTFKWFKVASLSDVAPHQRERLILVAISAAHERVLAPHRCTMWPHVPSFSLQTYQDLLGPFRPFRQPEFCRTILILIFCQSRRMSIQDHSSDVRKMLSHTGFDFLQVSHRASWPIIRMPISYHPPFCSRRDCLGHCSCLPKAFAFWRSQKSSLFSLPPMMFGCQLFARLRFTSWEMQSRFRMQHWGFVMLLAFLNNELSQIDIQELMLAVFELEMGMGRGRSTIFSVQ